MLGRRALVAVAIWSLTGVGCEDAKPLPRPALPPAAAPTPAPPPAAPEAMVVETTGKVEVRRASAGPWLPVKAGDRLLATDAIRTFDDGHLELSYGAVTVRVDVRSELQVKTLTERAIRARLKGYLESDIGEGEGLVEIEAEGSDALARSRGGRFTMMADGRGVAVVGAVKGAVNLASAGKAVQVEEGQVGQVRPGLAPDKPNAALRRVLLSVQWPAEKATNRPRIPVAGKVELGSRVLVAGRPVEVDAQGRFETEVSLRNGSQRVGVVVVDVLGRQRQESQTVLFDAKAPGVKVKDLKWDRP